jgi:Flp pilus assembly protein TadG
MRSSASSDDRGQAVVELALAVPLVCLLALGVAQVGLVVRDQLLVHHAAREAARAAAVSASPVTAAQDAVDRLSLSAAKTTVTTSVSTVRVSIEVISRTDVPLIGALVPDARLRSSVVMAREPP